MLKRIFFRIKTINAFIPGAYPKLALAVLQQFINTIVGNAICVIWIVPIVFETFTVKTFKTTKICTDPELFVSVNQKADNHIAAQAIPVCGIVLVSSECVLSTVIIDQTSAICSNP
jgi:hypothetical protein